MHTKIDEETERENLEQLLRQIGVPILHEFVMGGGDRSVSVSVEMTSFCNQQVDYCHNVSLDSVWYRVNFSKVSKVTLHIAVWQI